MKSTENQVSDHYTAFGQREPILAALKKRGIDDVTPEALAPFDQFHTGGPPATKEMAEALAPKASDHVLDVGSGLGGPARMLSAMKGCRVTGIDLAPHFVENANFFTGMTKQEALVKFVQGSATALPFADAHFDGAWHLHMCMNVPDKTAMYAEIFRVLKPGAKFVLHDPFKTAGAQVTYPVPWAETPATSFLWTPEELRAGLAAAGFKIASEHDATQEGLTFYDKLDAARKVPPSDKAPTPLEIMQKNHRANMTAGAVRILSLVAVKP
ncbi:MAG: methyltransferase domain-containing protein [Rhodospirillaceae bacterium]|nr:methyltransferase domain-containing protein [Rhodospirillaceae bacterium]